MEMVTAMTLNRELEVIKRHQSNAPVEMVPLANDLGIKVYYANLHEDISGRIERNTRMGGSSGYAIFVNENHSPKRRRFTIAHEIAHFILHRNLIGDGITEDVLWRSAGLSNSIEAQANKLAADILMPWHLLNNTMRSGTRSITALAERFAVSKDAMSIRVLGVPYNEDNFQRRCTQTAAG